MNLYIYNLGGSKVAKKNIFEKLGLVEGEYSEEGVKEDVVAESTPTSAGADPLISNLAKDEEELNDEEVKEIEGKLDVLIGAYEKNKLLTIEDIYRNARVESDTKKTIFMADVF